MQLGVIGLNHNSATVDIRERFAIKKEELEQIYNKLLSNSLVYEVCILSTCNRVEYYFITDNVDSNKDTLLDIICNSLSIDKIILSKFTYFFQSSKAIEHIFGVASGLDSLVLGEPQIFGQVKDAFEDSRKYGGMGAFFNRLFEYTLKVSKKVRTLTGISENPVSISYAAVELAKKIFGSLNNVSALVIGAGEMCELAARHLYSSNIKSFFVTNRTFNKALTLADEFNGTAIEFSKFNEILHDIDIVISSTGSDDFIVNYDIINNAMSIRKNKPMFFIDIAVPRDIDPKCSEIENIYIYDIDDLKNVVESNKKEREREAKKAWEIINVSKVKFEEWIESLNINPVIRDLRYYFDITRLTELEKFCEKNKITDLKEKERLDYLLKSTINKILHIPFTNLKHYASDKERYTISEVMKMIFNDK